MCRKVSDFLYLILFLSVWEINAEISELLKQDFYNIYTHVAFEARDVVDEPVTEDEIKYFLYTKQNPENYTEIDPAYPEELNNAKVRIVFIIHGWTDSRESQWYEDLKNAFLLRKQEYYVVQVDWSEPANQFYTISSYNVNDVGKFIGQFVVNLHQMYSIPIENFMMVGHSLGAQVSGFVGKTVQELLKKKLSRIVALDPAGPLFNIRPEAKRLNRTDAEVVQVIHTDGGTFGFLDSCGTIDFYPNGGNGQPGCTRIDLLDPSSVTDIITCDHSRAWQYFIEAVLSPEELLATKCSNWIRFKAFSCEEETATLGNLETRATGDFYLETNKDKPFAKKREGFGIKSLLSLLPSV